MQTIILTRNTLLFNSIKKYWDEDGRFSCVRFTDEVDAVNFLSRGDTALVLLDFCREFSSHNAVFAWRNYHCRESLPMVVIGQSFNHKDMLNAFLAGADDIVVGQIDIGELFVRALRTVSNQHSAPVSDSRIELGHYTLDKQAGVATYRGTPVRLTARQFAIAWLFFSNPGVLLSRSKIAHAVWGKEIEGAARTLEQHIYTLRRELSLSEISGVQMKTVYSLGYKLECADIAVEVVEATDAQDMAA